MDNVTNVLLSRISGRISSAVDGGVSQFMYKRPLVSISINCDGTSSTRSRDVCCFVGRHASSAGNGSWMCWKKNVNEKCVGFVSWFAVFPASVTRAPPAPFIFPFPQEKGASHEPRSRPSEQERNKLASKCQYICDQKFIPAGHRELTES